MYSQSGIQLNLAQISTNLALTLLNESHNILQARHLCFNFDHQLPTLVICMCHWIEGGTVAASPLPFRPGKPAPYESS